MPARHLFFKLLVSGSVAAGALMMVNDPAATRILPPKAGLGVEKVYDIPRLPEPRNRFLNDTTDPAVRYNALSGDP